MKERLAEIGVALAGEIGVARHRREEKVRAARAEYARTSGKAYAGHEERHRAIRAEFERRAAASVDEHDRRFGVDELPPGGC